ncbi:MAG: hypothetical protein ACTSVZ_10735 [Promethearchaeota archaeon]
MVMIDNAPSILFLWSYMGIIWWALVRTWRKKPKNPSKSWILLFGAFFLLAFGDVFHLLPRTYLWFQYSFNNQLDIYNTQLGILIYGIGLIFTGITMTVFYLFFYLFWKEEYINHLDIPGLSKIKSKIRIYDRIAYASVIIRSILLFLPWNNYGSSPVYYLGFISFRLLTNLPLYVIGMEVLLLFMKGFHVTRNSGVIPSNINYALNKSSIWIIVSYITYTISLLGSPLLPILGMLMIPKTIAYLLVLYYMSKYIINYVAQLDLKKLLVEDLADIGAIHLF